MLVVEPSQAKLSWSTRVVKSPSPSQNKKRSMYVRVFDGHNAIREMLSIQKRFHVEAMVEGIRQTSKTDVVQNI